MRARGSFLPVVLLLSAAFLPGASAGDDAATKQADSELKALVNEAIDRGAEWLLEAQSADGSFPSTYGTGYPMGPTALAALALLHSGVARDSFELKKAMGYLRRAYDERKKGGQQWRGLRVYSVSVTIMALAEFGRVRRTAAKDGDRYGGAVAGGFRLETPDLEWMRELTNWLVKVKQGGAWRYPEGGFDHSNTQYALLALKEARRCGLEVPEEVFAKSLRHLMEHQQNTGKKVRRRKEVGGDGVYAAEREFGKSYDRARGWGYVGANPPTGSMTTAGVAAVSICRGELRSKKYRSLAGRGEQSMRDGLAWLGVNFSVTENPRMSGAWHYYYLYGLERAGVLAGVVYLGDHRWYAEGARHLVNSQGPDGGWRPGGAAARPGGHVPGLAGVGDVVDSCFALLFLVRATARSAGIATEKPLLDLTGGEKLAGRAHRDLFEAAFREMDRIDEEERKKRARDFAFLGPRIFPPLLALLHSADEKDRLRAVRILRAVTGLARGYDPKAPAADREAATDRWTEWYLRNRSKLALDREARRIR